MGKKQILRLLVCTLAMISFPAFLRGQDRDATSHSPNVPFEVSAGTRFLIGLRDKIDTGRDKAGKRFKATTLEPISTPEGFVLPAGAEVRGHISRVEPAGVTGRARLWLSFDDIKTRWGRAPLIADVAQVPGEHSVKQGDSKEGEIEARTSDRKRELEATAGGAAIGAAAGAHHGGKSAAIGAAAGAAAAFLIASGYGQELVLEKGAKLEIELDRPLLLGRR
jgi:hypothetical protein